jgi:Fe-S cluster assembly ATP-binding protein
MERQTLEIQELHVSVEGKEILKGVNLVVKQGEIHALMGPNGSGKSTLSYALMGHPRYEITGGDALLNGESVTLYSFLRAAVSAKRGYGEAARASGNQRLHGRLIPARQFRQEVNEELEKLRMDPAFLRRYLNEGFSGGEKKRAEILQMALLKPTFAILDETDSGLDIDALRIVSAGINQLQQEQNMGLLVITHYQRILNYIHPQFVHIFLNGRIVLSDGPALAAKLEEEGYDWVQKQFEEQR